MDQQPKHLTKRSKFLSLVLRHNPAAAGVSLDPNGWVEVDVLLAALRGTRHAMNRETLHEIVTDNDKQRFAFSEDGSRIRASQGHSVEVDLQLKPTVPPDRLFHGTATRNLGSIRARGLLPGKRQHVHLSAERITAVRVGRRHGKPVVLEVETGLMHAAGHRFFLSANGVWLTDPVAPEFIGFPVGADED